MTVRIPSEHQSLSSPSHEEAEEIARRFAALGDPTRVRLVVELQEGEGAVQELAQALGVSVPNVSKHLQVLYQTGIVARRREGTFVYYSLRRDHVAGCVLRELQALADEL